MGVPQRCIRCCKQLSGAAVHCQTCLGYDDQLMSAGLSVSAFPPPSYCSEKCMRLDVVSQHHKQIHTLRGTYCDHIVSEARREQKRQKKLQRQQEAQEAREMEKARRKQKRQKKLRRQQEAQEARETEEAKREEKGKLTVHHDPA